MAKRTPACKTIGADMNGKMLTTCDRVEISPSFDLWMRGAKYGEIRSVRKGLVLVKMDNPRVKRLLRAKPADLKKI